MYNFIYTIGLRLDRDIVGRISISFSSLINAIVRICNKDIYT